MDHQSHPIEKIIQKIEIMKFGIQILIWNIVVVRCTFHDRR